MRKPVKCEPATTWLGLNETLRAATEETCRALLQAEQEGPRRKQFLKRIHSRLNKVRADRERAELL
jgi:hypothetical protein